MCILPVSDEFPGVSGSYKAHPHTGLYTETVRDQHTHIYHLLTIIQICPECSNSSRWFLQHISLSLCISLPSAISFQLLTKLSCLTFPLSFFFHAYHHCFWDAVSAFPVGGYLSGQGHSSSAMPWHLDVVPNVCTCVYTQVPSGLCEMCMYVYVFASVFIYVCLTWLAIGPWKLVCLMVWLSLFRV